MNIESKIAAYFNVPTTALKFDEDQYFAVSNSCTVLVNGSPFDVFFDKALNIKASYESV